MRYKLEFLAYAGTWDGVDTDVVEVLVPYLTFSKFATTTKNSKQFFPASLACKKIWPGRALGLATYLRIGSNLEI